MSNRRLTAGEWAAVVVRPMLAVAGSLVLMGALLAALGHPPVSALSALVAGAFGSPAAWTATLLKSSPLLLTGLAVALAFRCGVWNIGAEGQLAAGALAATALATRALPEDAPAVSALAVVAAGALGGALWGAAAGWLRAHRGVNEVVSTLMLNFIALQLVALAVQGPLQEASGGYPKSDPFPGGARLPAWGRLHLGLLAALAAAAGSWWLLFRSAAGLRLRAVGLAPRAAHFAGISPGVEGWRVLALAGALAGLAGAFEVAGVTGQLYEGLSPGYGYTAIAVALLARLNPLAVVPAALFFGALEAGAGAMQREAGVPAVLTQVAQGAVVLLSAGFAFADRSERSGRVSGPSEPGGDGREGHDGRVARAAV